MCVSAGHIISGQRTHARKRTREGARHKRPKQTAQREEDAKTHLRHVVWQPEQVRIVGRRRGHIGFPPPLGGHDAVAQIEKHIARKGAAGAAGGAVCCATPCARAAEVSCVAEAHIDRRARVAELQRIELRRFDHFAEAEIEKRARRGRRRAASGKEQAKVATLHRGARPHCRRLGSRRRRVPGVARFHLRRRRRERNDRLAKARIARAQREDRAEGVARAVVQRALAPPICLNANEGLPLARRGKHGGVRRCIE